jgi:hypothetical protein
MDNLGKSILIDLMWMRLVTAPEIPQDVFAGVHAYISPVIFDALFVGLSQKPVNREKVLTLLKLNRLHQSGSLMEHQWSFLLRHFNSSSVRCDAGLR